MKTDNIDPLLDDLFAEARVEVPAHSFKATKSNLLAGLAIGGAGLLTAKIITSSILKSKFFIMSISAVTIVTSAAIVYTTALKPTEPLTESHNNIKQSEFVEMGTPMGATLPNNLFIEQAIIAIEPDDSTIVVEPDSLNEAAVEKIIEETISKIDIERIEKEVEEIMTKINAMEIDISDEIMEDIHDLVQDIKEDTLLIAEIKQMAAEIEASAHEIAEEVSAEISHHIDGSRTTVVHRSESHYDSDSELNRQTFMITNNTTDEDLEDFNRMATGAGIDVTYDSKIGSSKIKNLNMKLVIDNNNGEHFTNDFHISNVKRNENFSFNITWYENNEGQAVRFSKKRNDCRRSCEDH